MVNLTFVKAKNGGNPRVDPLQPLRDWHARMACRFDVVRQSAVESPILAGCVPASGRTRPAARVWSRVATLPGNSARLCPRIGSHSTRWHARKGIDSATWPRSRGQRGGQRGGSRVEGRGGHARPGQASGSRPGQRVEGRHQRPAGRGQRPAGRVEGRPAASGSRPACRGQLKPESGRGQLVEASGQRGGQRGGSRPAGRGEASGSTSCQRVEASGQRGGEGRHQARPCEARPCEAMPGESGVGCRV
jgi:hypothetical protein